MIPPPGPASDWTTRFVGNAAMVVVLEDDAADGAMAAR